MTVYIDILFLILNICMSLQINIIAASPDEVLSDCHNQELTLVNESLAAQSASVADVPAAHSSQEGTWQEGTIFYSHVHYDYFILHFYVYLKIIGSSQIMT